MGNCQGQDGEGYKISRDLDKLMTEKKKEIEFEVKLLLLGTGESGKTTILKQFRILYKSGFNDEDRKSYANSIVDNIYSSMSVLIKALQKSGDIQKLSEEQIANSELIVECAANKVNRLTNSSAEAISSLWALPMFKERFQNRSNIQIIDSAGYFFDEIKRISYHDYLPTDQDILLCRVRTTGINELKFSMGGLNIQVIDVGGQRSERKKWIHCFEDMKAVFFIVAINEYDQLLVEDSRTNRLTESMDLFQEITSTVWFANTKFLLFLNKRDIFEEKIKKVPLKTYFEDYEGGEDAQKAYKFIESKFRALTTNKNQEIYTHITCATDTENIAFIFGATQTIFLTDNVKSTGLDF